MQMLPLDRTRRIQSLVSVFNFLKHKCAKKNLQIKLNERDDDD